ncbi:MAG: Ig-like domain-containing protein, partial [Bacilli bacterium]
ITLNKNNETIEVYEQFLLDVEITKGNKSDIVWEVDGDAVVIDNGVVTGVKVGTSTVRVTLGKASAECIVIVVEATAVPILVVDKQEIQIQKNTEVIVEANITYKGNIMTASNLVWESEDSTIVEVSKVSSNTANVKSLKAGNTKITVSTDYYGLPLLEEIEVKVVSNISLELDNLEIEDGKYNLTLITDDNVANMEETTLTTNFKVELSLYDGSLLVENPNIIWESKDVSIATVSETGKIEAVKEGNTIISATYKDENDQEFHLEINVSIIRATVNIDTSYDLDLYESDINLNLSVDDNITSIISNGHEILLDDATMKLDKAALETVGLGKHQAKALSDTVEYFFDIEIITRIIDSKETLDEVFHPDNNDSINYSGYYVLSDDIEYNDHYVAVGRGWVGGDWQDRFNGTLDGRGHYINGVEIKGYDTGFFRAIGPNGLIKNISFTNAIYGGTGNTNQNSGSDVNTGATNGGFMTSSNQGVLENIYLQVSMSKAGNHWEETGVFVSGNDGGSILNVFIDIIEVGPDIGAIGDRYVEVNSIYGWTSIEENVRAYAVGRRDRDYSSNAKEYLNYQELLNNNIDFTNWENDFWTIINDVPYPKGLDLPGIEIEITNENTILTMDSLTTILGTDPYSIIEVDVPWIEVIGNKVKVLENALFGVPFNVTVKNVFDNTNLDIKEFTVIDSTDNILDSIDILLEEYSSNNYVLDLSELGNLGNLVNITQNGNKKNELINNNQLEITDVGNQKGAYNYVLTFEERENDYLVRINTVEIQIIFISKVLNTKEDLDNLLQQGIDFDLNGYYILGADIDYNADWFPVGGAWVGDGFENAFAGTFDGRGYSIKGLTVVPSYDNEWNYRFEFGHDSGMFKEIAPTGVIKDIAFVDAIFGYVPTSQGFLAYRNFGTISNVYISVYVREADGEEGWRGLIASNNYGLIENVFVNYNLDGGNIRLDAVRELGPDSITRNVYTVGKNNWERPGLINYHEFETYEGFINSGKVLTAQEGWSKYWGVDLDGNITFGY